MHFDVTWRGDPVVKDEQQHWDTVKPNCAGTGHELDDGYQKDSLSSSLWEASKD